MMPLSFAPVPGGTNTSNSSDRIYLQYGFEADQSLSFGKVRWRFTSTTNTDGSSISSNFASTIKYITSSDTPSLWVALDAAGAVVGMWESEDPISAGDTVPPMSVPTDDRDVPLAGYSVVNVGLPTFSVIERLYSVVLTETQRTSMLSCTNDYLVERGWLSAPMDSLVDTATMVSTRYEPSSRQWMMRCGAKAAGVGTPSFYGNLVVSGEAWARPAP